MGFALLLIGLVPLLVLGDLFSGAGTAASAEGEGDEETTEVKGSVLSLLDTRTQGTPLSPVTNDPDPYDGAPADPETALRPNEADDPPVIGAPVDPEDVLIPVELPGEWYEGEAGSTLQQLLDRETDLRIGIDRLGGEDYISRELLLGDEADQVALPEDGACDGTLDLVDGTPRLESAGGLTLVEGGGGDDTLVLGNTATYAFGGEGADRIAATSGTTAMFGGEGNDTLGGGMADGFIDGGAGDDTILGGDGSEWLFGGAHDPESASIPDDDRIEGGPGDDRIAGGYGSDFLSGGAGDDVIDHHGRLEQQIGWERHAFDWHIDQSQDTLDGGDGSDTLVMDRADTATGGAGVDTFWVYHDEETGSGAAQIMDFQPGLDFLRISLNPGLDHEDLAVAFTPSEDAADTLVTVDGNLVAVLHGVSGVTGDDVLVEVTPELFA
jgi:Ca2+-binding RTX toxin-like protein